ncbi:MAG: hypothetical protein HOP28_10550 [Gemmatimonadales bacterium]|nr:hypothetical protein [Gemmatimonadales bacterium]
MRAAALLAAAMGGVALPPAVAPSSTLRLLVLPARFADSPLPPVSREQLQREFFDGPSAAGTLPDFFAEASGGRLALSGEVGNWVQTAIRSTDWENLALVNEFLNMRMEQAAAAIRAADPEVDFGLYDNDGPDGLPNSGDDDGTVDAGVALLWAEPQSTCNGTPLHPEAIRFANAAREETPLATAERTPSGQPIVVRRASFSSAVDCSGLQVAGIAVLAHELGHQLFNLPDVYSPQFAPPLPNGQPDRINNRRWILGCWEIMAAGSGWGCGSGAELHQTRPSLFGPGSREAIGWLVPTLVPEVRDQEFILRPTAQDGGVLRIPVRPGDLREYFQIEYRQRIGFDDRTPGSGVLIYSVDTTRAIGGGCSGTCRSYREQIVEADARGDLLRTGLEGGNRGEASDAFASGGTAPTRFAANTTPAARARDGSLTTLTIHNIKVDEGARTATIRLSTARTPAFVRNDGANASVTALAVINFVARAAGGALPYAWTATGLPPGVQLSVFPGTDSAALVGSAKESGAFPVALRVQDALGGQVDAATSWQVGAPAIAASAAVLKLLRGTGSTDLSPAEAEFLDLMGNRNGRFDVGDARALRGRQR